MAISAPSPGVTWRELLALLKRYEAWEAKLILEPRAWQGLASLPTLTQELWDELLEIQALRNAVVAKAEGLAMASPLSREQRLTLAAQAVLLFHSSSPWDNAKAAEWDRLMESLLGHFREATTWELCNAVRAALQSDEERAARAAANVVHEKERAQMVRDEDESRGFSR